MALDFLTRGADWWAATKTSINGKVAGIPAVQIVDGAGIGTNSTYSLASNATLPGNATTTPVTGVKGGRYIFAYQFGGTSPSLILESLGPDGATYQTVATVTAGGSQSVEFGENSTVRLRNGTANSITGLSASLS